MKKIIYTLGMFFMIQMVNAQSSLWILDQNYNNVTNGSYTESNIDPLITFPVDAPIEPKFYVVNNSAAPVDVFIKKVYINSNADTKDQFCWAGGCWNPTTLVSPTSQSIASLDTTSTADALKPQFFSKGSGSSPDFSGSVTIRYIAFVASNPNDSVYVDVTFTSLLGEENIKENNKLSGFYPNPAKDFIYANFQIENPEATTVAIFDLSGSKVREIKFNSDNGILKADISALKSGVYFYTLFVSGKAISSKRLIIAK